MFPSGPVDLPVHAACYTFWGPGMDWELVEWPGCHALTELYFDKEPGCQQRVKLS
jgi:hypothetical protein